jgi:hypothetical protein
MNVSPIVGMHSQSRMTPLYSCNPGSCEEKFQSPLITAVQSKQDSGIEIRRSTYTQWNHSVEPSTIPIRPGGKQTSRRKMDL